MHRLHNTIRFLLFAACQPADEVPARKHTGGPACECVPAESPPHQRFHGEEVVLTPSITRSMLLRRETVSALERSALANLDEHIRSYARAYCSPCDWVHDSSRVEDMYPLEHLDDSTGAGCLFLTMADGTRRYGKLRPLACR